MGQQRISSRWEVTEKQNHNNMKVKTKTRLAMRDLLKSTTDTLPLVQNPQQSLDIPQCKAKNKGQRLAAEPPPV